MDMIFRWTWEPPASWQQRLDRLFPRSARWSWLKVVWMPGDRWEPVQRWVIYQMTPPQYVPEFLMDALQGPSPRTLGYYDEVLDEFVTDSHITLQQWQLYRETGCHGSPLWIIQGSYGGHKRRFAPSERKSLKLRGFPGETPAPGDLPYATMDNRAFEQLVRWDRLRRLDRWIADEPADDEWLVDRHHAETAFRDELDDWLGVQIQSAVEDHSAIDVSELPKHDYDPNREYHENRFRMATDNPIL